jgi:hypothetical protein
MYAAASEKSIGQTVEISNHILALRQAVVDLSKMISIKTVVISKGNLAFKWYSKIRADGKFKRSSVSTSRWFAPIKKKIKVKRQRKKYFRIYTLRLFS